jgi:predicted dehydrogenase
MKEYRVAVVGTGRMAGSIDDEVQEYPAVTLPYSHAAAYAAIPATKVVAAADIVEAQLKKFCDRWNVPGRYKDYREMIEREKPEILSITTPGTSHAEICIFAASHGVKGIYCEKAMACSMEECDRMVEAVERNGVKFNLGTLRRWQVGSDVIKDLLRRGELGRLAAIVTYGVGSLLHSASHYFDLVLFFADDAEVDWVQGTVFAKPEEVSGQRVERDVGGHGIIQFKNGVRGYALETGLIAEFEIIGGAGTARIMNNSIDYQLRKTTHMNGGKWKRVGVVPFPNFERRSPTVRCIEDIIQAIESGGNTRGNVRVARAGTEIALGILTSHKQGGSRVSFPLKGRSLYMVSK